MHTTITGESGELAELGEPGAGCPTCYLISMRLGYQGEKKKGKGLQCHAF